MPAGFENFNEPDQIAVHVCPRRFDRVAHAGLCGQMHHARRRVLAPDPLQSRGIDDIALDQLEIAPGAKCPRAVALEAWSVVVIEIVETHHALTTRCQGTGDMGADEAGSPGNEHGHVWVTTVKSGREA